MVLSKYLLSHHHTHLFFCVMICSIVNIIFNSKEAQRLKEIGVNIIIVLEYSGYKMDKEIAKKCPLADFVIGSHLHSFISKNGCTG